MTHSKKINQKDNQDKTGKEQEYLNGWLRAKADYENLKKRTEIEKQEFIKFANTNLIFGLLPVYNNLKISFDHLPSELEDNGWVVGIKHVQKQFWSVLEHNGLKEIVPKIGDQFNPSLHEAIEGSVKEKNNIGKIIQIVANGYSLNDKILLPAKVIVE